MRAGAIAKIVAALVLVLVVAVIGAGKALKSETYNAFLADRVKAATGLDLTFAGPTKLRLGAAPVLSLTGVTLSAGKGADILYIDRIEARVGLVPLAMRQLRLESLTLIRPTLHLGNLEPLLRGKAPEMADPPSGAPLTRFALTEVVIEDGAIVSSSGTARLAKALVRPESEAGGPLSLQVDGRWQGSRFEIAGTAGPLAGLAGTKPYPVQMKGHVGGANVTLRGTLTAPLAAKGLDLEVRAQGEELAELAALRPGKAKPQPFGPFKLAARLSDTAGPLALSDLDAIIGRRDSLLITAKGQVADALTPAGIDVSLGLEAESVNGLARLLDLPLPNAAPVKLSGRLTDAEGGWRLSGLKSTLGRSDLAGEITLSTQPRPRLSGRLSAAILVLGDFTLPSGKAGDPARAAQPQRPAIPIEDGRLLGVEPLPLDLIRDLDASLSLSAAQLQAGPATLAEAAAEIRMAGGRLAVESFTARAGGGALTGEARLDAAARIPSLAIRLAGAGLNPSALTGGAVTAATADLALDLRMQGANPRAMAGTADGSLSLGLTDPSLAKGGDGDLPSRLAGAIDPAAQSDKGIRLRCLAVRLPVKAGLASLDRGLGLETAAAAAVTFGSLDLRTETLDIAFVSRGAPPQRLRGTLAAPVLTAEGGGKGQPDATPCRTVQGRRLVR
jgi:uncharacterized protein involved in outer membrane biogenesis